MPPLRPAQRRPPSTSFANSAKVYNSAHGDFIDARHQRLAEIISDYSPNLSIVYIPEHDRDETDTKPFAILDTPSDTKQAPYIVRYLTPREMDDPEHILLWIWEGDFKKHSPNAIFNRIEARETAKQLLDYQEKMDEAAERQDLIAAIATGGRDGRSFFRHNGTTYHR